LWHAFASVRLGGHVSDIGHAVEAYVRSQGDYGIVEEYVGHGIGTAMHEEPDVPNYGPGGRGMKLKAGFVLAIEQRWTDRTACGWRGDVSGSRALTPPGAT
jgi:methionyl aminopeptidase